MVSSIDNYKQLGMIARIFPGGIRKDDFPATHENYNRKQAKMEELMQYGQELRYK